MALSSRSSVSEDVPTLIKMCRASGRFSLLRINSLSFASPLPPHQPLHSSCASATLYGVYACNRTQVGIACDSLKSSGSVTWTAAAVSSKRQVAICGPRMCRHFLPPIDRPITELCRPLLRPSEQDGEHVVVPSTIPDSGVSCKNRDGPGTRQATKRETLRFNPF